VTLTDEMCAERVDRGRLSDAGYARYSDADSPAGPGEKHFQQILRFVAVLALLGFHQRDGTRESGPIASTYSLGEIGIG
jgi:hypothetical protein